MGDNKSMYGDIIPSGDALWNIGSPAKRIAKIYVRDLIVESLGGSSGGGAGAVPSTRRIDTSGGLLGGGDLSQDRTHTIDTSYAFTWTGLHTFNGGVDVGSTLSIKSGNDLRIYNVDNSHYMRYVIGSDNIQYLYDDTDEIYRTWYDDVGQLGVFRINGAIMFRDGSTLSSAVGLGETGDHTHDSDDIAGLQSPNAGDIVAMILSLPRLRAFWPFSSIDAMNYPVDLSGQLRYLENINNVDFGYYKGIPYAKFGYNPNTNFYLRRGHEEGLSLDGALTIGGLFYFTDVTNNQTLVEKLNNYGIYLTDGKIKLKVAIPGLEYFEVTHPTGVELNTWYMIVGRFVPGLGLDIFLWDVKETYAKPIVTLNKSDYDLFVGTNAFLETPTRGYTAMMFLCAEALPDTLIARLSEVMKNVVDSTEPTGAELSANISQLSMEVLVNIDENAFVSQQIVEVLVHGNVAMFSQQVAEALTAGNPVVTVGQQVAEVLEVGP